MTMNELMIKYRISVWLDPDHWTGSGLPMWLAGTNMRPKAGRYYSPETGSDDPYIEAENTANGDTPEEAVDKVAGILLLKETL